jgi:hypothetical protein
MRCHGGEYIIVICCRAAATRWGCRGWRVGLRGASDSRFLSSIIHSPCDGCWNRYLRIHELDCKTESVSPHGTYLSGCGLSSLISNIGPVSTSMLSSTSALQCTHQNIRRFDTVALVYQESSLVSKLLSPTCCAGEHESEKGNEGEKESGHGKLTPARHVC